MNVQVIVIEISFLAFKKITRFSRRGVESYGKCFAGESEQNKG
jgi:hypothetical protein